MKNGRDGSTDWLGCDWALSYSVHKRLEQAKEATVSQGNSSASVNLNPILAVIKCLNIHPRQISSLRARTSLVLDQDDVSNVQRPKYFRALVVAIDYTCVEAGGAHLAEDPQTFPFRPA